MQNLDQTPDTLYITDETHLTQTKHAPDQLYHQDDLIWFQPLYGRQCLY